MLDNFFEEHNKILATLVLAKAKIKLMDTLKELYEKDNHQFYIDGFTHAIDIVSNLKIE